MFCAVRRAASLAGVREKAGEGGTAEAPVGWRPSVEVEVLRRFWRVGGAAGEAPYVAEERTEEAGAKELSAMEEAAEVRRLIGEGNASREVCERLAMPSQFFGTSDGNLSFLAVP